MINTNEDNYITGWNSPTKEQSELLSVIDELKDKHRNYKWQWIGGEVILNPQEPTVEQKEKERKNKIEKEIPYSIGEEIALINKGIDDKEDPEYIKYRSDVELIKSKYPKDE